MKAIYQKLLYFYLRSAYILIEGAHGTQHCAYQDARQSPYITDRKSFALLGVGLGLVIVSIRTPHIKRPFVRT